MLEINKLLLVAGHGGHRMDFISGWLGTLPMFLDNNWSIDPLSGKSYGLMSSTKCIDSDPNALDLILSNEFKVNPSSNFLAVGSFHGYKIDNYKKHIDSNKIEVLAIDVEGVPVSKLHWDFFVKTYLSFNRNRHAFFIDEFWLIDRQFNNDEILNDQTRVEKLKLILKFLKDKPIQRNLSIPEDIPHKKLLYKNLFVEGGSYYLQDQLNIKVDQRYHQAWNCLLPLATAPDTLTVLGQTWKKEDYFID
jgi:hypothetical protein